MCVCVSASQPQFSYSISLNKQGGMQRTQTQTIRALCHFSRSLSLKSAAPVVTAGNGRKETLLALRSIPRSAAGSQLSAMSPAAGKYPRKKKQKTCFSYFCSSRRLEPQRKAHLTAFTLPFGGSRASTFLYFCHMCW